MAVKQIVDGLHMVPVGAVNVYLLDAPEGLTLIDTGFPKSSGKILEAMRGLGKAPRDLKHIVLTHAHPDHIGSLAALAEATGARTIMHPTDAPIAESGAGFRPMTPAPGLLPNVLFRLFSRADARVGPAKIDADVEDGDVLPLAGGLQVIHVPGHCAGQIALLWTRRKVLFVGDACANMLGLGPPIAYEERGRGERSQRKLSRLDFEIACFGHGKPIMRGAAARFRKAFPS